MTPTPRPRRKKSARIAKPSAAASPAKRTRKAPASSAARAPRPAAASAHQKLVALVQHALEDMKAVNVRVLDVRGLSDVADTMIVASGNSDRHVKSIADRVVRSVKDAGIRPYGIEGERDGEWVLVDLPDLLLHVMLPRAREFYALEELWEPARPATRGRASRAD